jgi:hypothetical protein
MGFRHASLGGFLLLLLGANGLAQEQAGALEGTVRDATGSVVAGALVEATSAAGARLTVNTDERGFYRMPAVPPGRWDLEASKSGFQPARVEGVRLALGQLLTIDLPLEHVEATEEVEVVAEAPLVDVRQSARFTNIRDEDIEKMPKGRDFTSLVTQAPGANWEKKTGGLSIDGATDSENRYMVDGIETTHIAYGISGMGVVTDFVEEVQVKSSGYTAEYGGATGGVLNVLTKSGTNTWQGAAWTYFRGDPLGYPIQDRWDRRVAPDYADGRPSLRRVPTDPGRAEYVVYPKDDVTHWEPGFSLGGPVLRDRVWFFASYNPSFQRQSRTVTLAADESVVDGRHRFDVHNAVANVTAQLGSQTRARVAFNNGKSIWDRALPGLDGLDDPRTHYDYREMWPNWSLSGNLDYVASSSLYLAVRGGYHYQDFYNEGIPQGVRYIFMTSNAGMPDVPEPLQQTAGYMNMFTNYEARKEEDTRLAFQADATWFVNAGGRHALKAGVQYNRFGERIDSGNNGNVVWLGWDRSVEGQRGRYGYYQVLTNEIDPERGSLYYGDVHSNNWALFVQDAWTLGDRLTLNLGLRAEHEQVPSYSTDPAVPGTAIEFSFADKLAPRLGFAWDPQGDGRLKVYGSWGLFYDTMKLWLPWGAFGGFHQVWYGFGLDTAEWPALVDAPGCPPDCPGDRIYGPLDFSRLLNDPENNQIDPDLQAYRLQEATAGVEYAVTPTLSVAARYIHKQLDWAVEDIGDLDADQNPIYAIGNPGFGRATVAHVFEDGTTVDYPRARRDYDAVEVSADKRYAEEWSLRLSYLWSRLRGNYSGLVDGDFNGLISPNLSFAFDHRIMMFNEAGTPIDGPLPTDRPHQLKMQLVCDFPFGTTVGLNGYLASGTPVSRSANFIPPHNFPVLYRNRESDGRTPTFSQLDLYLQQEFGLGGSKKLQILANILNVFDQGTAVNRFPWQMESGAVSVTTDEFFRGIDTEALIAEQGLYQDPRFLMDSEFQLPREIRIGVRFVF